MLTYVLLPVIYFSENLMPHFSLGLNSRYKWPKSLLFSNQCAEKKSVNIHSHKAEVTITTQACIQKASQNLGFFPHPSPPSGLI
jgi:hypothetical protein